MLKIYKMRTQSEEGSVGEDEGKGEIAGLLRDIGGGGGQEPRRPFRQFVARPDEKGQRTSLGDKLEFDRHSRYLVCFGDTHLNIVSLADDQEADRDDENQKIDETFRIDPSKFASILDVQLQSNPDDELDDGSAGDGRSYTGV